MINNKKENSWRNFQSNYIIKKRKKDFFLTTVKVITGLFSLLILIMGIWILKTQLIEKKDNYHKTIKKNPAEPSKKKMFLSVLVNFVVLIIWFNWFFDSQFGFSEFFLDGSAGFFLIVLW